MRVFFVRHAEKEKISEDPSITAKGIKQANLLAKRLKTWEFDEFYCSDMKRVKQTAFIVSRKINMIPKFEKSLSEFRHRFIEGGKKLWNKEEKKHYEELTSFLNKIAKEPESEKSILIISHGVVNRLILAHFLNLDMVKTVPFNQSETGISCIEWSDEDKNWEDKKWRVQLWNDNQHIPVRLR